MRPSELDSGGDVRGRASAVTVRKLSKKAHLWRNSRRQAKACVACGLPPETDGKGGDESSQNRPTFFNLLLKLH